MMHHRRSSRLGFALAVACISYACSSATVRSTDFSGNQERDSGPPPPQCDREFPIGTCSAGTACQFTMTPTCPPGCPTTWTCSCNGTSWSCNVTSGCLGATPCPDAADASDSDAAIVSVDGSADSTAEAASDASAGD